LRLSYFGVASIFLVITISYLNDYIHVGPVALDVLFKDYLGIAASKDIALAAEFAVA
jgi:hypothetical protein